MNRAHKNKTLAIVSLVFGILSVVGLVVGTPSVTCLALLGVPPAIVTGIIAYSRARRLPEQYGGAGFAIAGLVTGCVSLLLVGTMLAVLARKREEALSANCVRNMQAIGIAARNYSTDNNDRFPGNFLQMSDELATSKVLVCPADKARMQWSAAHPATWDPKNITYEFLTPGLVINATYPTNVAFRCPIHGHEWLVDGSIRYGKGPTRAR